MDVLSGLRVARVLVTLPCESTRIGAHLAGGASGRRNSAVDAFASFIFAASSFASIRASLRLAASSSISRSVGNIDLAAGGFCITTGSILGTAAFRASSTPMPAPESRLRIAVASLSGTPTSMAFFSENVVRSSGRRYLFTLSASVTAAIVSASSPRPTSSQHRRMNSAREPCDAGAAPSLLPASGGNNGGADVGLARSTPSAVERHRGVDARVDALDTRLTASKITRRITNHPASLAHHRGLRRREGNYRHL
mmetsp:Transcript_9073/g.41050  ORF Transcript_9073/g.41050 Transcript_9073/m.41050 type:complete len:253 (-) Transcript_9073:4828-5586(-)